MTRLALGAKCGTPGSPSASDTPPADEAADGVSDAAARDEKSEGFSSEASAAVPIPAAARPKSWRRVRASWCWRRGSIGVPVRLQFSTQTAPPNRSLAARGIAYLINIPLRQSQVQGALAK